MAAVDGAVDASKAPNYRDRVERFLTLCEIAERLNMTTRQVYGLVRSGELAGIQVGGRNQWRVAEAAWRDYLARNGDDGDEPPLVGALV
jgi:excisionase family DNA binding protein